MTAKRSYSVDIDINKKPLVAMINALASLENADTDQVLKLLQKNPSPEGRLFSKTQVLNSYNKLTELGEVDLNANEELNFKRNIRMKKVRTISGVTPVTVLTKPFPCPGKCIFCPNDVKMPKSYMSDEPGAQRAEANNFDPYFQTFNRLTAYRNMGHPTAKCELIILGGTWSHYPEFYQIWFIKRCFDAMNDFGKSTNEDTLEVTAKHPLDNELLEEIKGETFKKTYNQVMAKALIAKVSEKQNETATWQELEKAQKINEKTESRCVGLVVETRPDEIDEEELLRIRRLGGTKIQIGIQSLNDKVLELNKRGHDVSATRDAINLIRQAGFKIHAHWMPNLYGSTAAKDKKDYLKLFTDDSIKPDELKIYPCSLIESAELMKYYKEGKWKPYSEEALAWVLEHVFMNTPRYCRLTRVIRDIPSTDIVVGNKKTNFRQIVERNLAKEDKISKDIRAREIKGKLVEQGDLTMRVTEYATKVSDEQFIEFVNESDEITGFVRFSLPTKKNFIDELEGAAIIREVHVYGQSVEIGSKKAGKAQHIGLGKTLIKKAEEIAQEKGFKKISVITAIGTREYYKKLGYKNDAMKEEASLYLHKSLA